ncbi:MAG TPA: hypothetical protein VFA34_00235 [Actinomycetota bacterium]|nr:hypothetical protein [Actinomycetota bacterium]
MLKQVSANSKGRMAGVRIRGSLALVSFLLGGLLATIACALALPSSAQEGDARFLEVTRRVPQFGGAYVEGESLHLWLTRPSQELQEKAVAALLEAVGSEFETDEIVLLKADYSFKQLYRWHQAATNVLSIDGVVFTDLNERKNRIDVGTQDPERHRSAIEAELSKSGVPLKVVRIVRADPMRPAPQPWLNDAALLLIVFAVVLLIGAGSLLRASLRRHRGQSGAFP